MPWSATRRSPHRRVVGALVVAGLVATGGAVALSDRPDPAPREAVVATTSGRARVAPGLHADLQGERTAAVLTMLAARSRAVRMRDRAAFLATVDPAATAFRARQAALFDHLDGVPLAGWDYVLDASRQQPRDPAVDARSGKEWWAPHVALHYRLAGFDDRPSVQQQGLTLVPRGGRWLVAADDDFAAPGGATVRGLWDAGPVVRVTRPTVLVLGHPGDEPLLGEVADAVDAAVPRVTRFWGPDWARRVVVLVPHRPEELQSLVSGDLSQIAAVATAEVGDTPGGPPVGDRVVVNPETFGRLGPVGRRVVLAHEVVHVATRSVTGPAAPAWLVEGVADHVGYLGAGVPLRVAARDLRADVRAGRVPAALPDDAAFDGAAPQLGEAYEQAWTAVELLVRRYGRARTLELYREIGRAEDAHGVDHAFDVVLGTTVPAFTRAWRDDLVRRLG